MTNRISKKIKNKMGQPAALVDILEKLPASKGNYARCLRAAKASLAVRRLREVRESQLSGQGLAEYLRDLANKAGMTSESLGQAMRWFGLSGSTVPNDGRQVAKLAHGLGMSFRELMVRVLRDAVNDGGEGGPVLCRGGKPKERPRIEEYEALFAQVEWDPKIEKALKSFEREAIKEYARSNR